MRQLHHSFSESKSWQSPGSPCDGQRLPACGQKMGLTGDACPLMWFRSFFFFRNMELIQTERVGPKSRNEGGIRAMLEELFLRSCALAARSQCRCRAASVPPLPLSADISFPAFCLRAGFPSGFISIRFYIINSTWQSLGLLNLLAISYLHLYSFCIRFFIVRDQEIGCLAISFI